MHLSFPDRSHICSIFWIQSTHTHRVNISVFWLTSTKVTQRLWRFILFIAAVADPVNQVCSFKGKHRIVWDFRKMQLSLLIQYFTSPYLLSFQWVVVLSVKRCSECRLCFPETRPTVEILAGSVPGIGFGPGWRSDHGTAKVYTPHLIWRYKKTCTNHYKLSHLNELGNFVGPVLQVQLCIFLMGWLEETLL